MVKHRELSRLAAALLIGSATLAGVFAGEALQAGAISGLALGNAGYSTRLDGFTTAPAMTAVARALPRAATAHFFTHALVESSSGKLVSATLMVFNDQAYLGVTPLNSASVLDGAWRPTLTPGDCAADWTLAHEAGIAVSSLVTLLAPLGGRDGVELGKCTLRWITWPLAPLWGPLIVVSARPIGNSVLATLSRATGARVSDYPSSTVFVMETPTAVRAALADIGLDSSSVQLTSREEDKARLAAEYGSYEQTPLVVIAATLSVLTGLVHPVAWFRRRFRSRRRALFTLAGWVAIVAIASLALMYATALPVQPGAVVLSGLTASGLLVASSFISAAVSLARSIAQR